MPMPRRRRPPKEADVPGLAARRAALRLLDAVLRRGEALETALHAATQGLKRGSDKGLAHAIAADTLRWLPDIDALIAAVFCVVLVVITAIDVETFRGTGEACAIVPAPRVADMPNGKVTAVTPAAVTAGLALAAPAAAVEVAAAAPAAASA